MTSKLSRALSFVRVSQIPRYARRLLGLRHVEAADFLPEVPPEALARLRDVAEAARAPTPEGWSPAILVFGVLPRSGTNFVRDVLALHPDVHADAGRLYEFPLLDALDALQAAQAEFVEIFPRNSEILARHELAARLAGAWMRALRQEAGPGRRVLLKNPHVRNLPFATAMFPGDKIVLVLRDGRDVIDSSLRTFGDASLGRKSFVQLAWEWRYATEAILTFEPGGPRAHPDVMVLRYEDMVTRPDDVLPALLSHVCLDPARLDRAAFDALPVRGSSRSTATDDARWRPEARSAEFNPLERWRSWSRRRKSAFDRIAGQATARAGYPQTA